MIKALNKYWPYLTIIIICIVSRLPQLLSPHFIADGDECIMGIMSKHFIEGKSLPFFFYGQNYGFAFLEVLAISGGYLLFGMSDYVVKLSVFTFWIIGVVFFYKTLLSISNNKLAALGFALLLVLTPAWAVWSMKARGGYLTSFMLSNIMLYVSVNHSKKNNKFTWFLAGITTALIFFSQPLWLPGLLPFLFLALWQGKAIGKILPFLSGITGVVVFILIARIGQSTYWQPAVIPGVVYPFAKAIRYAYYNFTGFYYLQNAMDAPFIINIYVYVFSACVCAALISGVSIFLAKGWKAQALFVSSVLSALCTFVYFFIIDITSPRYALPLTGYAIMLLFIVWMNTRGKIKLIANSLLVTILLLGCMSMYKFKDYVFEVDKAIIKDAITKMEQRGITHVYATDPLLYWNFVFYSHEKIIGRHFSTVDRYVPYICETDSVHAIAPHQTAVLTTYSALKPVNSKDLQQLNSVFCIYQEPTQEKLQQLNFTSYQN